MAKRHSSKVMRNRHPVKLSVETSLNEEISASDLDTLENLLAEILVNETLHHVVESDNADTVQRRR